MILRKWSRSHSNDLKMTLKQKNFYREKLGLCGILWVYSTDEILKTSYETKHQKRGFWQPPGHVLS